MDCNNQHSLVSFDSEQLILVDKNDLIIGYQDKTACHKGEGLLHRAFSLFIFNSTGKLLLQQRSANKHLWPLFWSNSCCSHPRKGETLLSASSRRLKEELGLETKLNYLYRFVYQVRFDDKSSEHELCSVFAGYSDDEPKTNSNEIENWRYIAINDLNEDMKQQPQLFTPWFKLEWQHIKEFFPQYFGTLTE